MGLKIMKLELCHCFKNQSVNAV